MALTLLVVPALAMVAVVVSVLVSVISIQATLRLAAARLVVEA
ncbi:hypothetical protein [Specibacter sp. NPDC078709]